MERFSMVRIKDLKYLQRYKEYLTFTDGTGREVDLERYLQAPIFEPIKNDPTLFRAVRVDPELGTIVWENGADIDPDVLFFNLTPAWMVTGHNGS
jgi:hypothetical protein